MGKKGHALNPYEITGPFRVLLKDGKLFAGVITGAWDNAFLLSDIRNGDCIIFIDSIAVLMEGIEPPAPNTEGGNQ
jgi:hypothetical protein